jgi:hypothetical protein
MPGAKTVNRAELQRLARLRPREAKVLLAAKECAGAYYLAGYAVEYGMMTWITNHW